MKTEAELFVYVREISVIADTWVTEASSYAKYRAIGEGFKHNIEWLQDTNPPSISFFNGLTAMLDLALVMSVWKITEKMGGRGVDYRPGEVVASERGAKRIQHDEIRSLSRAAFLFRQAFAKCELNYQVRYSGRQREIVDKYNLPQRNMSDYVKKSAEDRQFLLEWCDIVDALATSDEHKKLDIIRNQGFAHSAVISRKSISLGIGTEELDFTRSTLFSFGDKVMQVALDFEAIWYQRARSSIDTLIEQNIETGAEFWRDARKGLARF